MEFCEEEAKDACFELPSKDVYKPNQFLNKALSGAEVIIWVFTLEQILIILSYIQYCTGKKCKIITKWKEIEGNSNMFIIFTD